MRKQDLFKFSGRKYKAAWPTSCFWIDVADEGYQKRKALEENSLSDLGL